LDRIQIHFVSPFSPLFLGAPKGERRPLPKRATAFREGHKQIFDGVSEDFLGGDGKADGGKLLGVGILPKPCPRKSAAKKGKYIGPKQSFDERLTSDITERIVVQAKTFFSAARRG
jgi:hypothetical protein